MYLNPKLYSMGKTFGFTFIQFHSWCLFFSFFRQFSSFLRIFSSNQTIAFKDTFTFHCCICVCNSTITIHASILKRPFVAYSIWSYVCPIAIIFSIFELTYKTRPFCFWNFKFIEQNYALKGVPLKRLLQGTIHAFYSHKFLPPTFQTFEQNTRADFFPFPFPKFISFQRSTRSYFTVVLPGLICQFSWILVVTIIK